MTQIPNAIIPADPMRGAIDPSPQTANSCVMTIVVTKATLARLQLVAAEMGRNDEAIWQIASDAVDETALQAFRNRNDDPGQEMQS